jgi:hypothetical protein
MLTEGVDYLFFRSAYHSGGAITGLKNSEVAVIATRRFLFLVPIRETAMGIATIKVTTYGNITEHLAQLLASPDLTLDTLETELRAIVGAENAIALDGLASLTVWSRFLRQVRFKQTGKRTQVLALRGKANHVRFQKFYAEALAS